MRVAEKIMMKNVERKSITNFSVIDSMRGKSCIYSPAQNLHKTQIVYLQALFELFGESFFVPENRFS